MGDSNSEWGSLATHDQEFADAWDGYERLPEPGENPALDAFCESKHIDIAALLRQGARLAEPTVLAFAGEQGIKFRDIVSGRRWSRLGSEWPEVKLVLHGAERTSRVIVCEGETDGGWLSSVYPCDVAIMQAGAKALTPRMIEQLSEYEQILVALDRDAAGEEGAAKWFEQAANTERLVPTGDGDWCDQDPATAPELPEIQGAPTMLELPPLVAAGAMLDLDVPEQSSWFEHELLPIGGLLILHGWIKSFKSFLTLDMMAALAQGLDWACFEPIEEPCKVAVIQYEIPWAYYRQRVYQLRSHAREPELFDEHFFTYTPLRRPELVAGNKKHEDRVLGDLTAAGIQVVMIDPIRRLSGAIDMNSEQEVRRVLGFFERVQDEGITVVTTHHDSKESAKTRGGEALGMTGSGAFGGDPDSVVSIELPRGEDYATSPRRNLNFLLRNAPSIGARSMEIKDDSKIVYSTDPLGYIEEDDGANLEALPSI
jgi:hypothetical protein